MKYARTGLIISIALHLSVISLVIGMSRGSHKPLKTVVIDFTLLAEHGRDSEDNGVRGGAGVGQTRVAEAKSGRPETGADLKPKVPGWARGATSTEAPRAPTAPAGDSARPADPQGDTRVYGETHSGGVSGDLARAASAGGVEGSYGPMGIETAGGRFGPAGRGSGGGVNRADFSYIRDMVYGNIRYPERAKRKGLEGKVEVSFVILENGVTSEIEVVATSGHEILDNSAVEGVARTRVRKVVPYKRQIRLPVRFELTQSGVVE